MRINFNNYNNINFGGTLKIHNVNHQNTHLSEKSVKIIEKAFSFATKDDEGHMDVILFNRYNVQSASPDKIFFKVGDYSDHAETYVKNYNSESALVSTLVHIFHGFKDVMNFKNSVKTAFK